MQSRNLWLAAICLIAVGLLGYIIAGKRAENQSTNVVRTYKVAPERADEIRQTLRGLFKRGDDMPLASVQTYSGGLLLVAAPKSLQTGIANMIEQIEEMKAPQRAQLKTEYWLVLAEEGASNSASFKDLGKALSALEQADGPKRFRTLEHIRALSSNREEFFSKGQFGEIKGTLNMRDGMIWAMFAMNSYFGELKSNMELKPGEFTILGQNAVKEGERTGIKTTASAGSNVYHIIRTEIVQ